MFASNVPRNAFSAWHDPGYDVIGQRLGGQGLEIFRGDVIKMGESYRKNGDVRPVNKKDIPEKPQGGCINPPPPPPVPARVKKLSEATQSTRTQTFHYKLVKQIITTNRFLKL